MANNKMLIDASHPEETRVAVVKGNRIEEFDFESQAKKQLRGNIYLAKVTRVEPSLQAAFVDYGGNRHGFLAFSEIHPDYYQIPLADRQALIEEEALLPDENGEPDEEEPRRRRRRSRRSRGGKANAAADSESEETEGESESEDFEEPVDPEESGDRTIAAAVHWESVSEPAPEEDGDDSKDSGPLEADDSDDAPTETKPERKRRTAAKKGAGTRKKSASAKDAGDDSKKPAARRGRRKPKKDASEETETADNEPSGKQELVEEHEETVESVGLEDALEEVPMRRKPRRAYKIQEVVKRRQIMLVQVVKEERGNKGAALTTYLSLAGRYSVLMPNTARGGGISRKITSVNDRKRLKTIATDLDVQPGMGVILRTAGASRTKAEIKRDFEYLMRLWESVRALTLSSTAPCLVYEEGSLIKRSIRDLYNKDIGEILVAGEAGYREAKDFMRMLMPSHARNVKAYTDEQAIFSKNGVEQQLDRLLSAHVTLKSGGYVVINQTEALVSIDVNSGRSTREHSIEDTAFQTNLEAADEIARQLRLRDLAGLIVIDFIDMEEKKNNRAVEKRLKDALKNDRARIQVGRISHFGLMEMSRQRIRASVMESTMEVCPHCEGSGYIRSDSSIALHIFRSIEEHLIRNSRHDVVVRCPTVIAIDILNSKRTGLMDLEARHGVRISIDADPTLPGQSFSIERGLPSTSSTRAPSHVHPGNFGEEGRPQTQDDEVDENEGADETEPRGTSGKASEQDDGAKRQGNADDTSDTDGRPKRRRRRGRRGGRKNRRDGEASDPTASASPDGSEGADAGNDSAAANNEEVNSEAKQAETFEADSPAANDTPLAQSGEEPPVEDSEEKDRRARKTRRPREGKKEQPEVATVTDSGKDETPETERPKKSGWWSRAGGFF